MKFSSHISIRIELGLHLSSPNDSNPDWNIQVCHLRHSYSTAAEFVYFVVIKLSSNCEFSNVFMHIFIKLACLILLYVKLFAFWITIIKHIHKNFFFFDKLFLKIYQKQDKMHLFELVWNGWQRILGSSHSFPSGLKILEPLRGGHLIPFTPDRS